MNSAFSPPPLLEAEIYRTTLSGRNQAIVVAARAPDDEAIECVVKLSARLGGLSPLPHLLEWVAAALGRRLGIDIPEPYEVEITPAFAESLPPELRPVVRKSIGTAFGSRFCGAPYSQWPRDAALPLELREAATALLAFDL